MCVFRFLKILWIQITFVCFGSLRMRKPILSEPICQLFHQWMALYERHPNFFFISFLLLLAIIKIDFFDFRSKSSPNLRSTTKIQFKKLREYLIEDELFLYFWRRSIFWDIAIFGDAYLRRWMFDFSNLATNVFLLTSLREKKTNQLFRMRKINENCFREHNFREYRTKGNRFNDGGRGWRKTSLSLSSPDVVVRFN